MQKVYDLLDTETSDCCHKQGDNQVYFMHINTVNELYSVSILLFDFGSCFSSDWFPLLQLTFLS